MSAADLLLTDLRAEAAALGFDALRIANARAAWPAAARLAEFLDDGRHGEMAWMERPARAHPRALWPEAQSAIMLGMNYGPDEDPLTALDRRDCGAISVYARHQDYHDIIKPKLKSLGRWLAARTGAELKVFVDTAPLMEKPLAARAGLGWQGKHTNLVSRAFGSWLFLGAILIALPLPADAPEDDHCGSCSACLAICPTNAFPAPYQLDARLCISYLTIEHKGPIPLDLRPKLGNRIYGCDDCLAVCPWNKFAQTAAQAKLRARADLNAPPLAALSALDESGFRALFAGSPIKRIGRDRFVRNVLYAIGNSSAADLAPIAQKLTEDPAPLVRGAAIWALSQLDAEAYRALSVARAAAEPDPQIAAEWTHARQIIAEQ